MKKPKKKNKLRPSVVADIQKIFADVKSKQIKKLIKAGHGNVQEDLALMGEIANWSRAAQNKDRSELYNLLKQSLVPKSISKILADKMVQKFTKEDINEAKDILERTTKIIKDDSHKGDSSPASTGNPAAPAGGSDDTSTDATDDKSIIRKSTKDNSISGAARSISNIRKNIINLVKKTKTLTDEIKKNHKELIDSVQKNTESLTTIKEKLESTVKPKQSYFSGDMKPEYVTPEELAMYPGAPKEPGGRFRDPNKGTYVKTPSAREIKAYAKRKEVDPFDNNMNLVLSKFEEMLDSDSAIREKQISEIKDQLKNLTPKDNSGSVFNLESDEQKQILEKALYEALQEIGRKHPELFAAQNTPNVGPSPMSPFDFLDWRGGGNSPTTKGGGFWRSAARFVTNPITLAVAGTAATAAAIDYGLKNMGKEAQDKWKPLQQYDLYPIADSNGKTTGYVYQGKQYNNVNKLPQKAQDLITTTFDRAGTKPYSEASIRLQQNKYDETGNIQTQPTRSNVDYELEEVLVEAERPKETATGPAAVVMDEKPAIPMQTTTRPIPRQAVPQLNTPETIQLRTEQTNTKTAALKTSEPSPQTILTGNVENQELQAQQQLNQTNIASQQDNQQPIVNNIITNPPPRPAPSDDEIKLYNNDNTFNRLLAQDFDHPATYSSLTMG